MKSLFLKSILPSLTLLAAADQQTMLESFTLASGLEAKLWAGTDLIHSPVAMDVDARGRVWVTEDLQNSGEKDREHN